MAKYVVVNQTPNYLCSDILSAISRTRPDLHLELWHGLNDETQLTELKTAAGHAGPTYDSSNLIKKFWSWLLFTLWVFRQIRDHQHEDTHYLFFSNPPTLVFLNSVRTLHFDYVVYDLYPDALRRLRVARLLKPIITTWKQQNAKVLPRAGRIFVVGEKMAEQVRSYLPPASHSNVKVVSLWADQSVRRQEKSLCDDFKKQWRIDAKHVILYSGNIGASQPVKAFLKIAQLLGPWHDWVLVIAGRGSHAPVVQRRMRAFSNVAFRSAVPQDELGKLLSMADWGLVLLSEASAGTSVPSKAYNLMAAGVPLLAMVPEATETAQLIDEDGVGLRFTWRNMRRVLNDATSMTSTDRAAFSQRALETSKRFTAALAEEFVPPLLEDEVQP